MSGEATTQRINAQFEIIKNRNTNYDALLENEALETSIVKSYSPCQVTELQAVAQRLTSLNPEVLKTMTVDELYNIDVMKAASCAIDSIFYDSLDPSHFTEKINYYFRNLRVLSGGVEGMTLQADFKEADNMFIIKTPKKIKDDSLKHELAVAIVGTNSLRAHIPNFSYIYGGFKCAPTFIENKEVTAWCQNTDNLVNYILYENIQPSLLVDEYVRKCTPEDYLSMILQMIYALKLAHQLVDFTHYDLHGGNVLMRKLDKKYAIKYENGYIITKYVATVIDYGFAHVSVGKNNIGKFEFEKYDVMPHQSNIIYDIYKLLGASMNSAYDNKPVFKLASQLMKYFNKYDDINTILKQTNTYFALPQGWFTTKLSLSGFETYIKNNFKSLVNKFHFNTPNGYPLLDCKNICQKSGEILKDLKIAKNSPIKVPIILIELVDLLASTNQPNTKSKIIEKFNYPEAVSYHLEDIDILLDNMETIIDDREFYVLDKGKYSVEEMKANYEQLGELIKNYNQYVRYYADGLKVAELYKDRETVSSLRSLSTSDINDEIQKMIEIVKANAAAAGRYSQIAKVHNEFINAFGI